MRLKRVFGRVDPRLDPFLLLDHFGSERPEDYMAGFPWHPHRGMETITYMLEGSVKHSDSLGNEGVIGPGDVQWMTAGSGIVHQEMPERSERLDGFQLWLNLPKANKLTEPRYRDVPAREIPVAKLGPGAEARVICGRIGEVTGPVQDVVSEPLYADLSLNAATPVELPLPPGRNAFVYLFEGHAHFGSGEDGVGPGNLVVFGDGSKLRVEAGEGGARCLLVSGKPHREPVAWGGPIVMNTREELDQAFREYREGTFLRHKK